MPYFKCRLINLKNGAKLTKEEYADDKIELFDRLSKNFSILQIKQINGIKKIKLKNSDILFFFSYLLELTKIGINIQEALLIMTHEIKSKSIKTFSRAVYEHIKSGQMFSVAVGQCCLNISDFYTSIISMGEISNDLERSFKYIVDYINVSNLIKSKTKKAIVYPVFLLVMVFSIIIGASVFMIPKMMEFGSSIGIAPSYSTVLLTSFATFISKNWYNVISGIFTVFTSISIAVRFSKKAKELWDLIKLKIPIVNSVIIKSNIAKFCIFFSIAYKSGVNIIDSLEKSKNVITNEIIKKEISIIASRVYGGSTLSDAMDGTLIPSFTIRMFKIGEATGELANSLDNVVSFYTREIDNLSDTIISSIKPIGIIFAGSILIWIISATILPIYTKFIGKMMQ